MTWKNPPPLTPTPKKIGSLITPEMIAGKSEGSQQKALMVWAALNQNTYPQLKWLVHIPNGGSRHIREAVELKAQGVKAGVPDLMLPFPTKYFAGLFIELKAGKNKTSIEQDEWLQYLSSVGYMTSVQWSWEGARDLIVDYLKRC
jgi:hypothetical protein